MERKEVRAEDLAKHGGRPARGGETGRAPPDAHPPPREGGPGRPVVANPVGLHRTLIRAGETGFLANTPAEWLEAIRRLARDPALRRRMGQAGRRLVEAQYSVPQGSASWLRLLSQLPAQRF